MRAFLIAGLVTLAATPVLADPAEPVLSYAGPGSSIIDMGCPACYRAKKKEERAARMLPPGTEINEVREVNGQKMLYTTENWLGGAPVTIVRKASDAMLARYAPADAKEPATAIATTDGNGSMVPVDATPVAADAGAAPEAPDVDAETTTAALSGTPEPFDASGFKLRLD